MAKPKIPKVRRMDIHKKMDPAKRRMRIVRDALGLLQAHAVLAQSNQYIGELFPKGTTDDTQMHMVVEKWLQRGCEACALGALLVATVRRFDDLLAEKFLYYTGTGTTDNLLQSGSGRWPLVAYLRRFFPERQLDLIEMAFEGYDDVFGTTPAPKNEDYERVMQYYSTYPNDAVRLEVILKNILRHKGKFVPDEKDVGKNDSFSIP